MMPLILAAYYHPTTIVFVDDNSGFLKSLEFDLPEDLSYVSFTHPEEALAAINRREDQPAIYARCFAPLAADPAPGAAQIDLKALERELTDLSRFSRFSTVMIDYSMPTMGGLEFAKAINSPYIQRVLLTGVADEATAVAAFNEGLIDHYMPKARVSEGQSLMPLIDHMQGQYFAQFNPAVSFEHLLPGKILQHPTVRQAITKQFKQLGIVEYYLSHNPLGYLMLRRDGSRVRSLLIPSTAQAEQVQLARRFQAPHKVIRQLERGQAIAYFAEDPASYATEPFPWEECLAPCTELAGTDGWRLGHIEDPPIDIDIDSHSACYAHFMAQGYPRGLQSAALDNDAWAPR